MLVVVRVDLRMALEAHGYRVVDGVGTTLISRDHVIEFHLEAAEAMANTAAAMARSE
jgi:hypothetical protein